MRIAIDAGHGGHDSGAVAPDGTREKDVVLEYAKDLGLLLEAAGHDVMLTRVNDDFVGLSLRAYRADDWNADCLISIHANASANSLANGAWVIYDDKTKPEKGKRLARMIFDEMDMVPGVGDDDPEKEVFPDGTGWVGYRQLTVISASKCPAVLVELGFLSNPEDLADLLKSPVRGAVCEAIARGTLAWGGEVFFKVEPEETYNGDPFVDPAMTPVVQWSQPVGVVAAPEEPLNALIRRVLPPMLKVLGPVAQKAWEIIVARLLDRLDEEARRRL